MQLNKGTELQNGKYRILGILGQGGFGITYLAQQERPNRKVAIKEFFMKEHCNRDVDSHNVSVPSVGSRELVKHFRHKFLKEADLIASFDNSNIIRIHDVFEENGTAYYVMEYLEGKSLKAIVDEQGALPEDVAVKYIRQVCNALKEVHENNLLHLDIKPANIMLGKKGNAVLIDFGISKHYDEAGVQTSSTGAGISEGYAPLEQYETGALKTFTPVTDIYAIGATLFFLLTGTRPPKASDVMNHGLPALPGNVSPAVRKAIETAMQPVTANRPQSVEEFLRLVVKKGDNDETVGDWEKETSNENDTDLTDLSGAAKVLNKNNEVPKEKKSSKGLWIIILLAVICGAVGGFMLLGGGNAVKKDSVKDTAMTVAEKSDTANKDSVSAAVIPDVIKDTSEIIAQTEPLEVFIIKEDKNADKKADDKSDDKSAEMSAGEACSKGNAAYDKKEFNAAAKLYLFAAEKGHADAQYMLARCYMTGRGVPVSEKDMVKWMTKAAEQGHDYAQNELGLCYKFGKGVEKSDSEAAKWFRKAAQQGNADGQCNLGICYEYGEGVEKSLETASDWYKRAAKQGHEEAKKYLDDIDNKYQSSSVTGTINGHEYVDLGLPSGLKWATCNVGASKPEEYGNYYAWGETSTKSSYTEDNSVTYGKNFSDIGGNPAYDVARKQWGSTWRLPTEAEFDELLNNCTWTWTTQNGINGYKVTSKKNGNSIFLPATWNNGTSPGGQGTGGFYWGSTPHESYSILAFILYFGSGYHSKGWLSRSYGHSVRPVSK
ncbi:MAG: SEL1-like repeat protein [Bacteroidaceae bacterium]|nr:SEL1-like repeat protein [Bacteroidaceae bacterium]